MSKPLEGIGGGSSYGNHQVNHDSGREDNARNAPIDKSKGMSHRIKRVAKKALGIFSTREPSGILKKKKVSLLEEEPLALEQLPGLSDRIDLEKILRLIQEVNALGAEEGGNGQPLWEIRESDTLFQFLTSGPIEYDGSNEYALSIEELFGARFLYLEDQETNSLWTSLIEGYQEEFDWLCEDVDVANNLRDPNPRLADNDLHIVFTKIASHPNPTARERCWEFARCWVLLGLLGPDAFSAS